jgi:hypothetical protein
VITLHARVNKHYSRPPSLWFFSFFLSSQSLAVALLPPRLEQTIKNVEHPMPKMGWGHLSIKRLVLSLTTVSNNQ